MKIHILEKSDTEIKFLLEDSNPQFANALRRIMLGEIPILAIDIVDFSANESIFYNEIIAHRMSLIPLVFTPKDFHFKSDHEDGKTDSGCEVIFAINKKGPSMVYSKDMKSSNPEVKPLYDNIPIVELFDDQKLKLEASASLGLGLNNARYQAANSFYTYYPTVKLNGKIVNPDEVIRNCPKGSVKIQDNKVLVDQNCDVCRECMKVARPEGVLEIVGDDTKFTFNVESISGLRPEDVVLQAVDILKGKVKEFGKEVGKIK